MKLLRTLAAASVTALLAAGLITSTASPSQALADPLTRPGTAGVFQPAENLTPLVDSQSGHGEALKGGQDTAVRLPGAQTGSALVRISVLDPSTDLVVSVAGEPALASNAGVSSSTTILAPVTGGTIVVASTSDADVRIELLASFTSEGEPAAGGTFALTAPVQRADSAEGLALGNEPAGSIAAVGVVGLGGVPSTDVRAAYVTVVAESPSAGTVSLAGQHVPLQAGTTITSTIVPVDETGSVPVSMDGNIASVKIFVRGYVTDASQNDTELTVAGGFVPSASLTAHTVKMGSETSPRALDINAPDDATHVAVSVRATASSETSLLHAGAPYKGRGRGMVVTPDQPGQPQVLVAKLDEDGRLPFSVRHGSVTAEVTVLGSLAGTATRTGEAPVITIESPAHNAEVDLSEVATFTVTGSVKSDANIRNIMVSADGEPIGTAPVRATPDGYSFSFETSAPWNGLHRFSFKVTDRLDRSSTAVLPLRILVPQTEDTVVSSDVVVQEGDGAAVLREATKDTLTFATDPGAVPGQVIVGSHPEAAPQGYLREVVAVQNTPEGFVLSTAPAAITDVILQADVSEQVGMITDEGATLYPANTVTPSDIVVDTGTGEQRERTAGAQSIETELESRMGSKIGVEALLSWSGAGGTAEESEGRAEHNAKKPALRAEGGMSLSGKTELSVALIFELKIKFDLGWFQRPEAKLETFQVALERELESAVAFESFGSFEASWEKKTADWDIGKVTFFIGPVPVYINAEAAVNITGGITGEVKASLTWSVNEKQRYGFEYDGQDLRAIRPWPPVRNAPVEIKNGYSFEDESAEPSVEGKIAAQVGPEFEFKVSIYDAAGPVITAGALAGAEATVESGEPVSWEVFIEGQVGVSVRLEVPIIDKVLLEAEVARKATLRISLLTGEIPWETFWNSGATPPDDGSGPPEEDEPVGLDPIEIPERSFEGSSLRVTLYWDNESDLDLSVQQPDSEWISYRDPAPSSTGGVLDIDAHANCSVTDLGFAGGLENVYWPEQATAEAGTYSIRVDEYRRCGFPEHAKWVLKVYVDEQLRYQQSGNTEQQFTFNLQRGDAGHLRLLEPASPSGLIEEEFAVLPEHAKAAG